MLPLNVKVHRSDLETQYGKSNYARRIRKIIAEYGWSIERHRGNEGANDDWYIRRSDGPVRAARIRREVAPKIRRQIYERDRWICQMCGTEVGETQDLTRAQCDHKVPAEREGPPTAANLHTLCLQCNLKKRQACMRCDLPSCAACPYAFPELYDQTLVLKLSSTTAKKLNDIADAEGTPPGTIIMRLIDGL